MARCPLMLVLVLAVALPPTQAQSPAKSENAKGKKEVTAAKVKQEPAFGLRFLPLSEALYAHLPELPHGVGVLIAKVLPDSPAQQVGLKQYDIVLSCNGTRVKDGPQLLQLVQTYRNERK